MKKAIMIVKISKISINTNSRKFVRCCGLSVIASDTVAKFCINMAKRKIRITIRRIYPIDLWLLWV
jgi:hypothetical protein